MISAIETSAQAPPWLWATGSGGTGDDRGYGIATDAVGNVFVTGFYNSPSITFGSFTLTDTGLHDIFVVKYSPSGNVLWATSAGGTGEDGCYSIFIDAGGNLLVTGFFSSPTITFGSTTLTNAGGSDIFVVKYSPSGNVVWATSAGGSSEDYSSGISTDTDGNVFVTGSFASPTITFASTTLTNAGNYDIFVVKYDTSGNALWAAGAGGLYEDRCNGISTDEGGNVFVTGFFKSDSITFGSTTLTNVGSFTGDNFVVKYDATGNVGWATSSGGADIDLGTGVSTDAGGNVIATGYFYSPSILFGSTTLTNAGGSDIFAVKYSPSGNVIWAASAGGTGVDAANGISTDADGNAFVTGSFLSPSIAIGNTTLTNAGDYDIFVGKYDTSGNALWATSAGGLSHDNSRGISTDVGGNVLVTGFFGNSSITFGSTTLTNGGSIDVFVAKLDNITGIEENIKNDEVSIFPNPASSNLTISLADNYKKTLVTITDITGKIIYRATVTDPDSYREQKIEVNVNDFAEGIYLVRIQSDEFLKIEKLVISK